MDEQLERKTTDGIRSDTHVRKELIKKLQLIPGDDIRLHIHAVDYLEIRIDKITNITEPCTVQTKK